MASSFSLMKKNQKIKLEKSFHPQGQTPWPAFSSRPLPAFVLGGISILFLIIKRVLSADKLRAKSGKTMVGGAAAGAYNICEAWLRAPWGNFCGPRFFRKYFCFLKGAQESFAVCLICRAKAQCGKEASLLT
jgi:hypothetical protein